MSMHVNNLIVDASTTVPTISTKVAVTSCGCGGCKKIYESVLLETQTGHTGGSNTFTLPPSGASMSTYVSSLENYRVLR
jgi:hypothetical protein